MKTPEITTFSVARAIIVLFFNTLTLLIGIILIKAPEFVVLKLLNLAVDIAEIFFSSLSKILLGINRVIAQAIGGEVYAFLSKKSEKKADHLTYLKKRQQLKEMSDELKTFMSESELAELSRNINS